MNLNRRISVLEEQSGPSSRRGLCMYADYGAGAPADIPCGETHDFLVLCPPAGHANPSRQSEMCWVIDPQETSQCPG